MNPTKIAYLTHTWNPLTGCNGPNGKRCDGCWALEVAQNRLAPSCESRLNGINPEADFMEEEKKRLRGIVEAYRTFTPTLHPERLDQPAKRKKPAVIGVCFMGDLFDPASDRFDVFFAIAKAYQHTYVFLTKRPDEMAAYILNMQGCAGALASPNWFLGFSARNQAEFDAGWPHMAKLAAAGWKVWVSLEPMQERINLRRGAKLLCYLGEITSSDPARILSGVIVGAQSGKDPVSLKLQDVRLIREQCKTLHIPFMYKQGPEQRLLGKKLMILPKLDGVQHTATAWSI